MLSRSREGEVQRRAAGTLLLVLGITGALLWPREPAKVSSAAPLTGSETVHPSAEHIGSFSAPVVQSPRAALVSFAQISQLTEPNAQGEFARVIVPASTVISAVVPFPGAVPGTMISLQPEDGGELRGTAAAGKTMLGDDGQVRLEFQVGNFDGLQRVTLRQGAEMEVLQFWVGAEPPVLVRN